MTEPMELRTERLLLRPYRLADVDDVFEYAREPEFARYIMDVPCTRRNAEEFVARYVLTSWDTNPAFAIEYDSKVVGEVALRIRQPDEIAELGYNITRAHWGKGLGPEAARAVVDCGFTTYELAKVYATANLCNVQSQRVMEKLGMTREAVLRSHAKLRGELVDEVYYGILREDWDKSRGR